MESPSRKKSVPARELSFLVLNLIFTAQITCSFALTENKLAAGLAAGPGSGRSPSKSWMNAVEECSGRGRVA